MAKRCPLSPYEVSQDETVALGVYSPNIMNSSTGEITPEGFKIESLRGPNHVDDCGNSTGISVARVQIQDADIELEREIRNIASKSTKDGTQRHAIGYATVTVDFLSSFGIETLDDGWKPFISHAVLRSSKSRGELRGAREKVLKALNETLVRW